MSSGQKAWADESWSKPMGGPRDEPAKIKDPVR